MRGTLAIIGGQTTHHRFSPTMKAGRQLRWLYTCMFHASNGPTGGVEPGDWHIDWPALDEPSEKEQAETRHTVAETDSIYLDRGVRSPDQVAQSRDGQAGWSSETIPLDSMNDDELDL